MTFSPIRIIGTLAVMLVSTAAMCNKDAGAGAIGFTKGNLKGTVTTSGTGFARTAMANPAPRPPPSPR